MSILEIILVCVLLAVSSVHVLWAFGIWFPIREEKKLVSIVVGGHGVTRMPGPIPCSFVAAALLIVAIAIVIGDGWLPVTIMVAAAVVFGARGIMAYVPLWRRMTPQEPFSTYDKRLYGPLCLLLSVGLFSIVL